jgi:hypothetical protein
MKGVNKVFEKEKNRFATSFIDNGVPIEIQSLIWSIIDELRVKRQEEMDYLQVFQLTIQDGFQIINNIQEQPFKEECFKVVLSKNKMLTTKIWVLDDGNYTTMLFPSDY